MPREQRTPPASSLSLHLLRLAGRAPEKEAHQKCRDRLTVLTHDNKFLL